MMDTLQFFQAVLPAEGPYFCVALGDKGQRHILFNTLEVLAEKSLMLDANPDEQIYFATATYREAFVNRPDAANPGKQKRAWRVAENRMRLKSFFIDIDCGADKADAGKGYATKKDAMVALQKFCSDTRLPTPIVVDSGGGIHAYFPLTKCIKHEAWSQVAGHLKMLMLEHGLLADAQCTADSARILRVPGTVNKKDAGNLRAVKVRQPVATPLTPEDFRDRVAAALQSIGVKPAARDELAAAGDVPAYLTGVKVANNLAVRVAKSAHVIADRCQQMAAVRDTKGDVEYPIWFASIGLIKHCDADGDDAARLALAQEWSSGVSDYDPTHVADKFYSWEKPAPKCEYFYGSNPAGCDGCPHRGLDGSMPANFASPLALGSGEAELAVAAEATKGIMLAVLGRAPASNDELVDVEQVAAGQVADEVVDAPEECDTAVLPVAMASVDEPTNPVAAMVKMGALKFADARHGKEGWALNEIGNAGRLYDDYKHDLRYCPEMKAWLYWNDGQWVWDTSGSHVFMLATRLPAMILTEGVAHPEDAKAYGNWAAMCGKVSTIENTIKAMTKMSALHLPVQYIDGDQMMLGIDGARQVVNLRNGRVRAARQTDFTTKSVSVGTVGDATQCVQWLKFLDDVSCGDQSWVDWMQMSAGYALTGDTSEQMFWFLFGSGSNGKGVMKDVFCNIMGDYCKTLAIESLMEQHRTGSGATPDLANLVGARAVFTSETEQGKALSESLVKLMTGEDRLSVRKLYGDQFEYQPLFKLWMLGNHKPAIKGVDNGIWRRLNLTPFERQFEPHEQDPMLKDKLIAEKEHIFAWMLEGCTKWFQLRQSGVTLKQLRPAAVTKATAAYRKDEDIVGDWIEDRCKLDANSTAKSGDLYDSYKHWAERNGYRPIPIRSFSTNLQSRRGDGIVKRKSMGVAVYSGIALRHHLQAVHNPQAA